MATKKRVLLEFPEFDNSNLLERCSTYSLIVSINLIYYLNKITKNLRD